MNAPNLLSVSAKGTFLSLDGRTSMEVRHTSHPDAAKLFTTDELRRHFLI